MGLFNSVEQLYTFMMAELFNDWERADEILKSDSPFDAVKLSKTVRVRAIDGFTGEVSTIRHAYDTEDWWHSAPSIMANALTTKFYGNRCLQKGCWPLSRGLWRKHHSLHPHDTFGACCCCVVGRV